ncbi:MAG: SUMF1/EgtB/PvdO family nonheme iron enzyme, partial [Planctomycetota bacterium]|nr:SUMF1/EgtB/PvdO family nonheme iron enzyme [Planctomycetota bacterium]
LLALALAAAPPGLGPSPASAHPIPESERWATVTHPGNQPYMHPDGFPIGRVDYEYQIGRTEITNAEWAEFANAYNVERPFPQGSSFYGNSIRYRNGRFVAISGQQDKPVSIRATFAARYANWLHNDKRTDIAAFESGAYDTSTFDEYWDDITPHLPGARYWLPTHDEWVKAAHFDPDRHGDNQPGYWMFPTTSDTYPLQALPWKGGETSAGTAFYLPVASYRDVQSPWGLWDSSGGQDEWTETVIEGSPWDEASGPAHGFLERQKDSVNGWDIYAPTAGLRLARNVPAPSSVLVCVLSTVALSRRRR